LQYGQEGGRLKIPISIVKANDGEAFGESNPKLGYVFRGADRPQRFNPDTPDGSTELAWGWPSGERTRS
jgi:hypothetical protein